MVVDYLFICILELVFGCLLETNALLYLLGFIELVWFDNVLWGWICCFAFWFRYLI